MAGLIATGTFRLALAVLFFAILPQVIFAGFMHGVYRLQMFTAHRLTPFFYSRRMFRLIQFCCGRAYTAWALNNYAAKLFIDGEYVAAEQVFTRAIELDPTSAHGWGYRGAARYSLGQYECALQYAILALEMAPEDEKPERARRITQFQNRQPFRIPLIESATGTTKQAT